MVKKTTKSEPSSSDGASKAVTRMMLRTLASTTARIFLPVTILFCIGLAIDLNSPSKPWGMAIGTGVGIIIAAVLVFLQLKDIRANAWQPAQSSSAETQPTKGRS